MFCNCLIFWFKLYCWLLGGCSVKANCPLVGPGPVGRVTSVGVFLKYSCPYLSKFWRKTSENSERLDWQAKPGIESGTSCIPALSTETLRHCWDNYIFGDITIQKNSCLFSFLFFDMNIKEKRETWDKSPSSKN